MLTAERVTKTFGAITAVEDLSLVVERGRVTSLVGPNGAGKTTVLNLLTGFLIPDSGQICCDHVPLDRLPPWKRSRLGIVRTFQEVRLCREMSVIDNVLLGFSNHSNETLTRALTHGWFKFSDKNGHVAGALAVLERCGLARLADERVEHLSYGEQKLLTIGCCLATDPRVLLLDEPVAGLQPMTVRRIAAMLRDTVEDGRRAILLIEHDLGFVKTVSDTVVVLDRGRVTASGTPSEITADAAVLRTYLS